jgi:hypothetical protein
MGPSPENQERRSMPTKSQQRALRASPSTFDLNRRYPPIGHTQRMSGSAVQATTSVSGRPTFQ